MKQTSIFKHVNGTKPTASRDFQFDLPIDTKPSDLSSIKINKSQVPTVVTAPKESTRLVRSKQRSLKKTLVISQDAGSVKKPKVNKKRKICEVDDLRQDLRMPKKLKIDDTNDELKFPAPKLKVIEKL